MQSAWIPLSLSLQVATWATLLNAVFGIAVAWALARLRFPGRDLLDALLTLPMVLPPTVLGYYLLVLIGRNGPIGAFLHEHFGITLIFTFTGAVIAATVVAFPLVMKSARAAFETIDPQFERAARVLGLSPLAVFFRVTLPLARRGILAGLLLAFARARRVRRDADGRRQHSGPHADAVDRRLRGGSGRRGRDCERTRRHRLGDLRSGAGCRRPVGARTTRALSNPR